MENDLAMLIEPKMIPIQLKLNQGFYEYSYPTEFN